MLPKYEAVCYKYLRPGQIKALREKMPIAYVVAGSLEWHGLHCPLGTDGLKAHAVCCEAALRYGGVVLPPFYLGLHHGGVGWGPPGWEAYSLGHNEREMFDAAVLGMARGLVHGGWRVLVGVTGHDTTPQRDALGRAIGLATADASATGFAVMEGELHVPDEDIPYVMGHAAAWETSCMMYAYPDKVVLDALRGRKLSDEEDLRMSGPEGIFGKNPLKYASADLGKRIIERMADLIGAKARDMWADLSKRG